MSQNSSLNKKYPPKTILFNEGAAASSMFLIRSGMVRIFKSKSDGYIEIDTLRAGQIVGEISFLDNNPRSASAETLTECELVEISQTLYQNTITTVPEWLKALIRAIAARLRATTTRLKNLEHTTSSVEYVDGNSKTTYVFLTPQETLKLAVSTLATANSATTDGGRVRFSKTEGLASGVFGIPLAKVAAFLECLREAQFIRFEPSDDAYVMSDLKALEEWIQFTMEESSRTDLMKRTLSDRGLKALEIIERNLMHFSVDAATETSVVNIAELRELDKTEGLTDAFRTQDLEELVRKEYFSQLTVISTDQQTAILNPNRISKLLRVQQLTKTLELMNLTRSNTGRRN